MLNLTIYNNQKECKACNIVAMNTVKTVKPSYIQQSNKCNACSITAVMEQAINYIYIKKSLWMRCESHYSIRCRLTVCPTEESQITPQKKFHTDHNFFLSKHSTNLYIYIKRGHWKCQNLTGCLFSFKKLCNWAKQKCKTPLWWHRNVKTCKENILYKKILLWYIQF